MYNQRKISKMQCVKLRSVMGSYLNIHLNLFPIYVLLLLLTLSHGRPSAKVRETKDEVAKSHRQQFRDKWYQSHNLYPSSSVNSVSNEYNSVVYDNNNPAKNTQVSSVVHNPNFETLVETLPQLPKATSSHADAISQYTTKVVDNDETEMESASTKVSESPSTTMNPNTAIGNPTTDVMERGEQLESYQGKLPDSSNTPFPMIKHGNEEEQTNTYDHDIMSVQGAPYLGNMEDFQAMEDEQTVDIVLEGDGRNKDVPGSQLITFRQNILRSLGHTERTFQVNTAPKNVTFNYNDDGSLAKFNITKKEYLQAYGEYMTNVKNRKLANRGLIGVKDRRKKAVSLSKTYHDNGTDLFSIGTKVLKLFRFDIHYGPTMEGADVRIRRVVLSVPGGCQITGHLQNNTDLPDLKELSNLTMSGNENDHQHSGEDEQVLEFDLTQNVTAWTVRSRMSSPFIVLAICSRDTVPDKLESGASVNRHPSHHGSSLKVVTKEFMKPSFEAQMKRRARRAAPTEPSTLRGFTHKRDNGRGRECANTRHGKTCCRRSLKIKFEDLGISDVILEPKEFDAHVCEGRCNARRVAYATTHAMFQHILHQTKGKKFAPRPCCVPTALTELDVLHLDQSGNRNGGPKLIVTILKDAIVKECGCS
ncbi:unnamed protein product [Orchesella dallaii]|uniref:TGF-beta family profile domain-containing protein n=1 Tax=Orchesella dallaii TaxID=48710 RepID=A0ABP1Q043_9HEXA